jgi:hypothetical protein
MLKDLLHKAILGYYFNEKTLQIAYSKGYLMNPEDHGYMKGMKAYHDLETDLCICRHFDNATLSLMSKGFKQIVKDDIKVNTITGYGFDPKHHIKESEVRKLLIVAQRASKIAKLSGKIYIKEIKGKQPKVIATNDINKQKEKQDSLMKDLLLSVDKLKKEKNKDKIAEIIFDIGNILKKNLFTLEDLKKYEKK